MQPTTPPEPAQTTAEPQSAPVVAPEPTQSPTEPVLVSTGDSTAPTMPPVAPEAPTPLDTSVSAEIPVSAIPASEPQNTPPAPVSGRVEPPPTPAPAPQPVVVIQQANPRSFLAKALEKIQFRKRAKLEKIVRLALEKKSITNDQVEKLLHISDSTAERYLGQLVKEEKLQKIGKTSTARYEPVTPTR